MKSYRFTKALCITVSLILISGGVAFGFPNFLNDLNAQYGTSLSCDVCHPYTATYGADYLSAYSSNGGSSVAAFQTIEPLDSDHDGFSNIEEFSAGTNPSDAISFPVVSSDTTPPTITIASPQAATYLFSSIPLEYTISDGSLELFLDNNLLSTPPAGVLTGLSIGKHTLRVQATDTAGNVGSSEVVFTLQAGLLTAIPDLNGNSSDDLACLSVNDNGGVRVVVRDSLSREKLSVLHFPGRFAPLEMTMVPDLNGNSAAELAVLGTDANGTVRVTIKDSVSDAMVNAINFPSRFSPISFSTLSDLNGNGVPEIAVLGVDNSGKVRVIIKDAETRANINTLSFPSGVTPVSMTSISDLDGNGVPELAVLWIGEFGKVGVMMKDPSTRSQVNVVYFPARFMPTGLAAIPDFDGSGNPELAVMGTDGQGSTRIFVKDSISRDMIQTIVLPAQFDSMSMTVVANMGDSNASEIATLQVDVDGLIRALVVDSQSSNKLTSVLFDRGSSPLPPNGETLYNAQCAICHGVNGYDATGSPDLAAKGSLIAGKFSAGHNGITLSTAEQTAITGFLNQYAAPPSTTNCTTCHGQPPSGTTSPNVQGAHLVHSALPNVGTDCSTCHGEASHNGSVDQGISATYNSKNATAVANSNMTCSNVSCHGGQTTPNWLTGSLNVNTDCRSCHTLGTGEYNSFNSGKHSRSVHVNLDCTYCHNTSALATNHFNNLNTSALEGPASATIGSGSTYVTGYNASTANCTNMCHGNKNW